jgi:hypothetical protein
MSALPLKADIQEDSYDGPQSAISGHGQCAVRPMMLSELVRHHESVRFNPGAVVQFPMSEYSSRSNRPHHQDPVLALRRSQTALDTPAAR